MSRPIAAIVGRPNVGKSSLFNMLAGRRIAIVDPTAGVTRDRIATPLEHQGRWFELIDTGGIGIVDADALEADVERQITHALDAASVILFVVDIRDGAMPLDFDVADRLRATNKPVIFIANKADDAKQDVHAAELYRLGFGDPLLASANSRRAREEILNRIVAALPNADDTPPDDPALKLAIVGRRNVGKSTFINALAREDRVIVSEIPGTTRDSIDVRFERDGKTYLAIDTAGVRKRGSLAGDIEFYSLHRAERSIRRADVVLHFFDARAKLGRVDKQLAEYVIDNHKPSIFCVNKWDLAKDFVTTDKMGEYIRKIFPMLDYVPIAFVTAKQGKNALRTLQLAAQLHKQAGRRIATGELNRLLQQALDANPPPLRFNRQGRLYYAAQVAVHPPTIALVVNGPELFDDTYLRYLIKVLRDEGPYSEVPIKLLLRPRGSGTGESEPARTEVKPPSRPKRKRPSKTWDL